MTDSGQALLELRLRNYKSVREATLAFAPLTVLVGPNGAGKSNLIDALRLLADAMNLQFRAALDARGGLKAVRHSPQAKGRPPRFGMAVEMRIADRWTKGPLHVHYGFEVKPTASHGFAISRERCYIRLSDMPASLKKRLGVGDSVYFDREEKKTKAKGFPEFPIRKPEVDPHALLLPVLSGYPLFSDVRNALASIRHYSISPSVVRDLHDFAPGDELAPDGRNIASVIEEMKRSWPEDYTRLCEFLGKVVPGVRSVQAVRYGNRGGLKFTQEMGSRGRKIDLEALSMSDGTLRVLGILTAVFQGQRRPLIVAIEEPEATIHPGALGVLMEALRHGQGRSRIVITTHSPDILDSPDLDPEGIRMVEWSEKGTRVSKVGAASADAVKSRLATVGELLRANFLRAADGETNPPVDLFPDIPEAMNEQSPDAHR